MLDRVVNRGMLIKKDVGMIWVRNMVAGNFVFVFLVNGITEDWRFESLVWERLR